VGLAAVIGDECSGGSAGEQVAEDAEGEREQALGDALGESAHGVGEVVAEAHLAFEVGEHGLDGQPDAGLLDLGRRAVAEPVALRGDELDLDQLEGVVELAPPQPLVAEQDAADWPQASSTTASRSCPVFGPTSS
jgi:hypothetical protein